MSEVGDLITTWKTLTDQVDQEMRRIILGLDSDCPERLREALEYVLLAPGKRLRPVLCLLACESICGSSNLGLANAVALEMVHCYSLVHDDLPAMDDDDLRRGRPTCHIQFDEATAILAGDALQALAFETISRSSMPYEDIAKSCLFLAQAAGSSGMVGGQVDDLLAEKLDLRSTQEAGKAWLNAIHRRKTGAMIRASVLLGGVAGGANASQMDCLKRFGDSIGIAFQIVDDLLDVESTTENTGKRTGKDEARGKLTFPGFYGIESSREQAKSHTEDAIAAVAPLGVGAAPLQLLARYILERSH